MNLKVFNKALVLAVFAALSCPLHLFAQVPQFDPSKIEFDSAQDREQFEKMPAEAKRVLFGLAPPPKMSPELKKTSIQNDFYRLAREYNMEKESPEWKYHQDRIINQKPFDKPAQPGTANPIEHYRFKGGEALPGLAEINAEFERKFTAAKQETARTHKRNKAPIRLSKQATSEVNEAPVMVKPKCKSSSIATLDIPEEFIAAGKPLDVLFLNGSPPFDLATAVGRSTELVVFGEKSEAEMASMYANLPISCLPFRIRSSGKKVTYAQGVEAMKNYDANPESKGTLDPTVKKYLEQEEIRE